MSKSDLRYAKKKLIDARPDMKSYQDYYDGDQPTVFSSERLREVFGSSRLSEFVENWCSLVINAVWDKILFKGWQSKDKTSTSVLNDFYKSEDLKVVSQDVHRDALITGHGYLIFDELDRVRVFRNDPLNVWCVYSDSEPDKMQYAFKMWSETNWGEKKEDVVRANLYYPDIIEKYVSKGKGDNATNFNKLEEGGDISNSFGKIPVIHFQPALIELNDITVLQDVVNKLLADMMVTGEFNAFRQRWVVSNANVSDLKSSPQSLWQFPAGGEGEENTKVGEFQAAELQRFIDSMDSIVNAIAVISRTPKHYLMDTGANISGEALYVMEAPLVNKVQKHIDRFSSRWEQVARFVVETDNVSSVWARPETTLRTTEAKAMKSLVDIGLPLKTVLHRFGWTEDDIALMEKDREEERKAQANLNAEAYNRAKILSSMNNNPDVE